MTALEQAQMEQDSLAGIAGYGLTVTWALILLAVLALAVAFAALNAGRAYRQEREQWERESPPYDWSQEDTDGGW